MNVDIKVSEESTKSVFEFTQRILGPVAEAADFLSDKIRFMRWKSAQRTLLEAKAIASERNIAVNEVPTKFLVPFLEKCSLEEEDSELVKHWAELLVTAIGDYSTRLISYADILAQLGPEEIHILEAMWINTNPEEMGKIGNIVKVYGGDSSSNNALDEFVVKPIDKKSGVDENGRYTLLTIQSVRKSNAAPETFQTGSYLRENSIFWLERLGLVKVISALSKDNSQYDYFTFKAQLTPLGYSFVKACSGRNPNKQHNLDFGAVAASPAR